MANKKKVLTDYQKDYILNNYNSISINKMAEHLNINAHLVKVFIKENNLVITNKIKTSRSCDYTDKDIEFIKNNYFNMAYKDIAKHLNKTEGAIASKVSKMGLSLKSEKWSKYEIEILNKYYPFYSTTYIINKFIPNRNWRTINAKAMELGISKIYRSKFDKDELKNMLIDLSIELGKTPTISDLLNNENIPSPLTYSKYFGSYENACLECGLKPNICLFGNYTNALIAKDNKTICYSNGELTITNYFIDNNIKFEKEKYYSEICNCEKFGLKRCDWYLIDYDIVIEYFGLSNKDYYKIKMDEKIRLCLENSIQLIGITERILTNNVLNKKFKDFI